MKSLCYIAETNIMYVKHTSIKNLKKKLNMRPCTGGPTSEWLAGGLCYNILSEFAPPPMQFPWSGTLNPEAEVLEKYLRSYARQ